MKKFYSADTDLSVKQLTDCIHMLAFSLAQQRETHTEAPLMDALSIVMGDENEANNSHIINEGDKIYKDALALIKTYMAPVKETTELQENRSQPRLKVSSLIKIRSLSSDKEWQGNLSNISWGGVRIRSKEPLGNNGNSLELLLPCYDGGDINILATIVCTWEFGGMYNTSVRFSMLHPQDESRLDNMLEVLLNAHNDAHRQHTRIAHRIDVTYWDVEELKSTLEDISKGGMKIIMPEPLEINKSIQLQLDGTDDSYSLNLRAHVIRQDIIDVAGFIMHQMALEFEHPTEELHSMVDTLMQNIINKGKKFRQRN